MNNKGFITIILITVICLSIGSTVQTNGQYGSTTGQPPQPQEFQWPEGKRMALSLTFDDARLSQTDKGIPLLDKYQVKATFYVSPENMVQRLNKWKEAISAGHEIGNHSIMHPCSGNFEWSQMKALEDYSLLKISREMDSASLLINHDLGILPVSYAYPCGQTYVGEGKGTKSYVPVVAARFESGRSWLAEAPNDPSWCDLAQLNSSDLDGKTFQDILKLIEGSAGKWLILTGHEMDTEGIQTSRLATIEEICRYASDPANGIWVANVHEIAQYINSKRNAPVRTGSMPYLNPGLPVEKRIDDLISRMTLEEKIGQLNMPCVYEDLLGNTVEEKTEGCRNFVQGKLVESIGPCGGFFTLANTILHKGPSQQVAFFNELQRLAIEKTRLGIPLMQVEEGTHGLMCSGSTIFPEGLTLGSTWNMDLIRNIYTTAAREARAVGIHALFTLVIEPNRDPRLGRNQEGYSEDPYFCSQMARTIAGAVQGYDISRDDKVIAGFCHYPGQSQPFGGLERGAMEISERTLREVFLPPWEAGIKDAGGLGVMATYPDIDGIPTHNNPEILTNILRGELDFRGLVLSEGAGVQTNIYNGITDNEKDAGVRAAKAGMDVSISFQQGYLNEMIESVKEGKISMATIDRSVRRILRIKYQLGLFENPYGDPVKAVERSHTKENQELALQAAREGIVLLKNEKNILPLSKKLPSVAVIGPNADDEINQLGDYTSSTVLQDITTVLDGIGYKLSVGVKINYVKGCQVKGDDGLEIDKAVAAARKSAVAIVVVGENAWHNPDNPATNGEGYDVATLELTGHQLELVQKVYATGTPTVVVLINGRPLAIPWLKENIPAIVEAWLPGEKGGEAVADILFGDCNPSGKLTITVPRHVGQFPFWYNYKPSKQYWLDEGWGDSYADLDPRPLYEFGYGLSYTRFEYSNLLITPESNGINGTVAVSADIKNTGGRAGAETVQLYIRDRISSVVTPVKQLRGFEKVYLEPGQVNKVTFTLTSKELQLLDEHLVWKVEPGDFDIMVGASSEDIRLKGSFSVH
jgi:beta-glucosidase